MDKDEILHKLVEIITGIMIDVDYLLDDLLIDVDPKEEVLELHFIDDLDVDSLSAIEIAVNVEEQFDIRIPDEDLASAVTVGQAVDYIWNARQQVNQEV